MEANSALQQAVHAHPYSLLFATISGAHLYGFASADSDYDLRGAHILPARKILGLNLHDETIEISRKSPIDLDLVTHDVRKFFRLMLKNNGYVLEQLYSPLIVHSTPEFDELKMIGRGCITRNHVHHYRGFSANQWELFVKESPRRVKPLLYVFRVLLTGIHLMRTGQIEANLNRLNDDFKLPFIPDLISRKSSGAEQQSLPDGETNFFQAEFQRLWATLEEAGQASNLPAEPSAHLALNDLLVRVRLATV